MTHVNTTLIETDYQASDSDHYIGVNCKKAITITLPKDPPDGTIIIVKAEMKPPLGTRRITVVPQDGSSIDGQSEVVLTVSYKSTSFLFHHGEWFSF